MTKKRVQNTGSQPWFDCCFGEPRAKKIQMSKKRIVIFGLHHVAVRRTTPDLVLGVILELVNKVGLSCGLKDLLLVNDTVFFKLNDRVSSGVLEGRVSTLIKETQYKRLEMDMISQNRKDRVSCVLGDRISARVSALVKNTKNITARVSARVSALVNGTVPDIDKIISK